MFLEIILEYIRKSRIICGFGLGGRKMAEYNMEKDGVYCSMIVGVQNDEADNIQCFRKNNWSYRMAGDQDTKMFQINFVNGTQLDYIVQRQFHIDYKMNTTISIGIGVDEDLIKDQARRIHYGTNSVIIERETADKLDLVNEVKASLEDRISEYKANLNSGEIKIIHSGGIN